MAITDLDGRYTQLNPAFCTLLGYDASELLGRRPEEFLLDHNGDIAAEIVEMLAGDHEQIRGEAWMRRPDGSIASVVASLALIRDDAGQPDFFFVQLQDISDRVAAEQALFSAERQLRQALDGVIGSVAAALDARDPYTAGHQRRVAEISAAIATELGVDTDTAVGIRLAATIHDIGKIAIPAEILGRPGPLSDIEFELIKLHSVTGHDIVAAVEFPWPIARMILEHHERLDGSGYPAGREGSDILLGSRIIAVADVVDAMSSHRPYRAALGIEMALRTIRDGRGSLFDADVIDACNRCIERWHHQLPSSSPPSDAGPEDGSSAAHQRP